MFLAAGAVRERERECRQLAANISGCPPGTSDSTADLEESEHEQDKLDFHSDNDDDDNNDDRYITVTYTPSKLLHSVKTRTTKLHQVASVTKVPDQNYEIHTLKNVVLC